MTNPGITASKSLFELALDSLPDGVVLIDADRRVIYSNPALIRHWRVPEDIAATRDESRMLGYACQQLVDPDAFLREVDEVTPTDDAVEDELLLKDGRILMRRSVPFRENGVFAGRLWVFSDVTEARSARIDPLCGIPNRRAYTTDFPAFAEGADDGRIRSVGIFDVDNFKAYNDIYGHAAGDLVLRQIGALLRQRLGGDDDLAFRIGGEEFLVACRVAREGDALAFFEAIRASIAGLGLRHEGNAPHGTVTISMGVGTFRTPRGAGELFAQVDAAMYRAKREGRNRIEKAADAA
ncbi:sensor domain-containing diguanylate cyclase [Sphingomonas endophytica]|uniref:sensor domain-containing diguanylate cyclase n=1 Tax=Sphingomonas endophytica TaxID=869719 RepID=UPI000736BE78|nr:sensor domain-containing diguanylate cyclase [Sphingomonas endophytica]